jgi:hypothetical protein
MCVWEYLDAIGSDERVYSLNSKVQAGPDSVANVDGKSSCSYLAYCRQVLMFFPRALPPINRDLRSSCVVVNLITGTSWAAVSQASKVCRGEPWAPDIPAYNLC